ncbi:MAG: NPCBM/NEW2 domain-containing protein [Sciscionella sp.]
MIPSPEAPEQPEAARVIPQALGVISSLGGVATLIVGGGRLVALATGLGAILLGVYIVLQRWSVRVDWAIAAAFAIGIAGAGVFGYALAARTTAPHSQPGEAQSQNPGRITETGSPAGQSSSSMPAPSADRPSTTPAATYLADMAPVDGGLGWQDGSRTVNAHVYKRSVVGSTCSAGDDPEETFNLGRQFTRFRATIGMADDAPTDSETRFTVIVDGKPLFARTVTLGEDAPIDIRLNKGLRLA